MPVHIRKMYVRARGFVVWVHRKARSIVGIKMLTMVGEKAALMAVPWVCWNVW